MVKTSYRLPEETMQALVQIADKCHNGKRTAALVEAVRRYQEALLGQVEIVGWVAVRVAAKARCSRCNGSIPERGFVTLAAGGRIVGELLCEKCAK